MEDLNFDNQSAKTKILWIIGFKNGEIDDFNRKPSIDFIIPSLGNQKNWIQAFDHSSQEALNSLGHIQKICENIKSDCQQEIKDPRESIDQTKKVSDKLSTLNEMIQHFNELMKRFKNPFPPKEEKDPE